MITEGSVTSLSCLVTISAHEERHQTLPHVELLSHMHPCCVVMKSFSLIEVNQCAQFIDGAVHLDNISYTVSVVNKNTITHTAR